MYIYVFQFNFLYYLIIRSTNWIKTFVATNPFTDSLIMEAVLLKV